MEEGVSFRDVEVDMEAGTATLHRPLLLDLGAVAKGLAVDLAARELASLGDFTIDAGGDLYLGGVNEGGRLWEVGIRHPRDPDAIIESVRLTNMAICTSGDYERRGADGVPHIVDPRGDDPAARAASVSVVASSAMVADGLGTAALVLGHAHGIALIEAQGAEGLLITDDLRTFSTPGFAALTATSAPPATGLQTPAA